MWKNETSVTTSEAEMCSSNTKLSNTNNKTIRKQKQTRTKRWQVQICASMRMSQTTNRTDFYKPQVGGGAGVIDHIMTHPAPDPRSHDAAQREYVNGRPVLPVDHPTGTSSPVAPTAYRLLATGYRLLATG